MEKSDKKQKSKVIKCYRFVTNDLKSEHGKVTWKVGKWITHEGEIKPCSSGLHACRKPRDVLGYRNGTRFFLAEARGTIVQQNDKLAASEMRLVKEVKNVNLMFLEYAIGCAKRVLSIYEKRYGEDQRPRIAIEKAQEVFRLLKAGKPAYAAARAADAAARAADAAARAADAAARAADAARAAYAAADAADAAARAAYAAARAAYAADAADAAARAAYAADAAECEWQNKFLLKLIRKYSK